MIFSISSNTSTGCTNGTAVPHSAAKSIALGSNGSNANVATCQLPAGWITVPSATPDRRHPSTRWTITATFEGNGNFQSVFEKARRGSPLPVGGAVPVGGPEVKDFPEPCNAVTEFAKVSSGWSYVTAYADCPSSTRNGLAPPPGTSHSTWCAPRDLNPEPAD